MSEPNSPNPLLVTIITVCLNNAKGLEQTIKSVASQSYPNLEYVVIDGGSTDGSKEVIRKYEDVIDFWVSERDGGIADAFNKGLRLARGEFIAFLNSGDYYLNETSLENLVKFSEEFDVIYGGIRYQRQCRPVVYPKSIRDISYWVRGSIPHQSAITSRKIFEQLGFFNLNRRYCMDYELFYRAYQAGFKFLFVPVLITSVNCEGVSAKFWREQLNEFFVIQKEMSAPFLHRIFYYYKRFVKISLFYTLVSLKILK